MVYNEEVTMMMSVVPGAMTGISTMMSGLVSINNVFLDMTRQIDASFGLIDTSIITASTIVAQLGINAANAFGEFQQGLKIAQMVSNQTAQDMDYLKQKANEFSVSYRTGIDQITEGLQTLGRAGLNSASEQTEVLKEGLSTAKLESRDLNGVLEELIQNTALLGGNLKESNFGEDSKYVNDLLVATSMTAPITTHDVSETLKYSGGIAAAAGAQIRDEAGNVNEEGKKILEDYMGAIAAFAQKGVTGSIAGTALRAFFNKPATQDESVKDALASIKLKPEYLWEDDEDTMKPVSEQIAIIKNQMEDLNISTMDQLQIWSKIVGGKMGQQMMKLDSSDIKELTKDIQSANDAESLAAGTFETYQAKMKEMTEQGQVAFRQFGEYAARFLTPFLDILKGILQVLSNPFMSGMVFTGALGLIFSGISKIRNVYRALKEEFSQISAYFLKGEELYTKRPSIDRSMARKGLSSSERSEIYKSYYNTDDVGEAVLRKYKEDISPLKKTNATPEDLGAFKRISDYKTIKQEISLDERSTYAERLTDQYYRKMAQIPDYLKTITDKNIGKYALEHGLWKSDYTKFLLDTKNPHSVEDFESVYGRQLITDVFSHIHQTYQNNVQNPNIASNKDSLIPNTPSVINTEINKRMGKIREFFGIDPSQASAFDKKFIDYMKSQGGKDILLQGLTGQDIVSLASTLSLQGFDDINNTLTTKLIKTLRAEYIGSSEFEGRHAAAFRAEKRRDNEISDNVASINAHQRAMQGFTPQYIFNKIKAMGILDKDMNFDDFSDAMDQALSFSRRNVLNEFFNRYIKTLPQENLKDFVMAGSAYDFHKGKDSAFKEALINYGITSEEFLAFQLRAKDDLGLSDKELRQEYTDRRRADRKREKELELKYGFIDDYGGHYVNDIDTNKPITLNDLQKKADLFRSDFDVNRAKNLAYFLDSLNIDPQDLTMAKGVANLIAYDTTKDLQQVTFGGDEYSEFAGESLTVPMPEALYMSDFAIGLDDFKNIMLEDGMTVEQWVKQHNKTAISHAQLIQDMYEDYQGKLQYNREFIQQGEILELAASEFDIFTYFDKERDSDIMTTLKQTKGKGGYSADSVRKIGKALGIDTEEFNTRPKILEEIDSMTEILTPAMYQNIDFSEIGKLNYKELQAFSKLIGVSLGSGKLPQKIKNIQKAIRKIQKLIVPTRADIEMLEQVFPDIKPYLDNVIIEEESVTPSHPGNIDYEAVNAALKEAEEKKRIANEKLKEMENREKGRLRALHQFFNEISIKETLLIEEFEQTYLADNIHDFYSNTFDIRLYDPVPEEEVQGILKRYEEQGRQNLMNDESDVDDYYSTVHPYLNNRTARDKDVANAYKKEREGNIQKAKDSYDREMIKRMFSINDDDSLKDFLAQLEDDTFAKEAYEKVIAYKEKPDKVSSNHKYTAKDYYENFKILSMFPLNEEGTDIHPDYAHFIPGEKKGLRGLNLFDGLKTKLDETLFAPRKGRLIGSENPNKRLTNAVGNVADLIGGPFFAAIELGTMAIQLWQGEFNKYCESLKKAEDDLKEAYSNWNSAEDSLRRTYQEGNPDASEEEIDQMIYDTYSTMQEDMAKAVANGGDEWVKKLNTEAEKGTELEYDEEKADGSRKEKEEEELSTQEEYQKAIKENTGALYAATAQLNVALSKISGKMTDSWWGVDGWTGWLTDQWGGAMDQLFKGGSKFSDENEFLLTQSQADENYAGYTEMAGLMMEDFKDAGGNWIKGMRTMMGDDIEDLVQILPKSGQDWMYSLANSSTGIGSINSRDNAKIQASMKNDPKTWQKLAREYAKRDVNVKQGKSTEKNVKRINGLVSKLQSTLSNGFNETHIRQAAYLMQMQEMYQVAQNTMVPIMSTNTSLAGSTLLAANGISTKTGTTSQNAGGTWGTAQVISGLVAIIAKSKAKEVAWQTAYEADPNSTDLNGDGYDSTDKAIIELAQKTNSPDEFAKEAAKRYNDGMSSVYSPQSAGGGVYGSKYRNPNLSRDSAEAKAPALFIAQVYEAAAKMTGYGYSADEANKFAQDAIKNLKGTESLADIYNTFGKNYTENPAFHQALIDNYLNATESDDGSGSGLGSGSGDKDNDNGTRKERVDLVLCNRKTIPKLNVNLFKKPPSFTILNKNFKLRDVKINSEDKPKAIMAAIKNSFIDIQKRTDPKIIQDEDAVYDPAAATDGTNVPSGSAKTNTS